MANVTSDCTVIATETFGKGKLIIINTKATVDDQDYIVFNNATLSNTLTGERLLPKFAVVMSNAGNPFSGVPDSTVEGCAWDATAVSIKGSSDNLRRDLLVYCSSDSSTGGD